MYSRKTKHVALCLTLTILTSLGLAACKTANNAARPKDVPPPVSGELVKALEAHATASPLPELAKHTPAEWAATPTGAQVLAWAKEAAATTDLPETTYTRYRQFRATGERSSYQAPYYAKRTLLTQETLAVWLGGDESRISRINDLIWSICEETTWVVPAHEKAEWTIDLFASETAANLGHVLLLVGDRLPKEVQDRIRTEVDRRILTPYLKYAHQYWWNNGSNNWTGVCAGSVGQAFLLFENDPQRRAQGLSLVMEQLDRFIQIGFEPDGGCLEGIGYWNYGLSQFIGSAEMLRARTDGAFDLLANEKMKAIARYPLAVLLGKDLYASFADSHEVSSLEPYIAARLAEREGVPGLLALTGDFKDWRLTGVLRCLLWWDGKRTDALPLDDVFLPTSGIARLTGGQLVLAAKAGHNAEPHNHNDIGSFVVAAKDATYLCDPGGGLYNAAYFSSKRYDNVFANSYGHSVPRIGGKLQLPGKEHCGTMTKTGDKSIAIRFERAYDAPELKEALRTFQAGDGSITLVDSFAFDGAGQEVEEAFMTWRDVRVEGGLARVTTEKGVLEIRADSGTFRVERLEEACKANHRTEVLTRLSITYPPSAQITAKFVMSFHPNN